MLDNIVHDLHIATETDDYFNIWYEYENFLTENDARILFTQDSYINPTLPNINMFNGYSNRFKSLFRNNNLTFINKNIIDSIKKGKTPQLKLDYSISMDTQVASYIEKYFHNKRFHEEVEFEEILYKLIDHDLNIDYIPYLMENMSKNNVPIEGIKQNLKEVIRFFSLDKNTSLLLRNMRVKNNIAYQSKCSDIFDNLGEGYQKELFNMFRFRYKILYLILMNIVEINVQYSGKTLETKIDALLSFMHYDLNAIFGRELTIALKFYELDDSIVFFNKVREINSKTLNRLQNMAWDLSLVRLLETSLESRPDPSADFFISYFLTFDKGLSQIIDLFPLKTILTIKKNNFCQTIPYFDNIQALEDLGLFEKYYCDEARKFRNQNVTSDEKKYNDLIKITEDRLQSYL